MTTTTPAGYCPHGYPTPSRCPYCRKAAQRAAGAPEPTPPAPLVAAPVPKPIWFDAVLAEAREKAARR